MIYRVGVSIATKEATMGKKEKAVFALAEDFKTVIAMVPKLEALIKAHKEIAAGYHKYRKNGGNAIPGIEKYLGIEEKTALLSKMKNKAAVTEAKASEEAVEAKKVKKNVKK
jgi:hypothetical protein